MFVSCHCHDERSNLRGRDALAKTTELIDYAHELGYKGVAITNHETISSSLKANKYITSKMSEEDWKDFKVINGNEIYLCKDVQKGEKPTIFPHFILLAKDRIGFEQLCILSNIAWTKNSFMNVMMRVPTYYSDLISVVNQNKGHLIASTACIGGTLGRMLLLYKETGDKKYYNMCYNWIYKMIDIFGEENFFLEMQPSYREEQIFVNKYIKEISEKTGIKYIITTDVHYLKKEDAKAHSAFLKAQDIEREVDSFYATTYMMSEEEIHSYMDQYLGYEAVEIGINNTMYIYNMVEYYDLCKPLHIPYIPLKTVEPPFYNKYYDKVPLLNYFKESKEPSDRHMVSRLLKAFENDEQFQNQKTYDAVTECLESIKISSEKMHVPWSAYLLQIADYVEIAWTKSLVCPGRGSGVGFILLYMLGITQINPLREKTKTYSWRFLNPERASVLDIDVDVCSSKRDDVINAIKDTYGRDRVSKVLTLNTEKSKSAIQTAARGLGINDDIAIYLSSLIIADRGQLRTLRQMYYGDKDYAPDMNFRNEMDKYPELWEVALKIEGTVNGCGSHAGGVIIVDEPFTKTTALMKTNSGEIITQYDLHECEDVSLIKVDLLATEGLDKINTCLNLLVEYGKIKKYPTLKQTYEACIGIYNLERENKDMWKMLWNREVMSFFQMEKQSGIQAVSLTKPESVDDLATINSVMRLMADDEGESPLEKYARFKKNIHEWYQEMDDHGVKLEDQEILKDILSVSCGICEAQEYLILLTMHPKIGGFSLAWGDKLRKAVAKKKSQDFEKLEKEFFQNAKKKHLDENLTNYVWNVLIRTQRGYGFNRSHTLAYSLIGLQELNLCYRFPIIYWNTANLIVDSGSLEGNKKTTNYGKIATAIGKFQNTGTIVELPDVNESNFGFKPEEESNSILFGLKGISGIGDAESQAIIVNRPYSNLNDFLEKIKHYKTLSKENKFGESAVITLIKAGAFDHLENKKREDIMSDYIHKISKPLKSLQMDSIFVLNELGLLTKEQIQYELRIVKFRKYIFQKQFLTEKSGKSTNTYFYKLEQRFAEPFFFEYFENNMQEDKDYKYDDEGRILVKRGSIDREFKKLMKPFEDNVLLNPQNLKLVNEKRFMEMWNEKVEGNISKWEMDSLSFYYHEHELAHVDKERYLISDFDNLPEEPQISEYYQYRGKSRPRFKLTRICGTVLDKDKNKHMISLLTPSGVVTVKFYKGQFSFYDKQISELNDDGTKTVLEKSWFGRGKKLLITGYRREEQFVPKKYADSAYRHTLQLINSIDDNGILKLQSDRIGEKDEF